MILYSPPTLWGLVRGAAINLLLPFINGLMLGFGELFAHEAAFRLGWGGTKVRGYWAPFVPASFEVLFYILLWPCGTWTWYLAVGGIVGKYLGNGTWLTFYF